MSQRMTSNRQHVIFMGTMGLSGGAVTSQKGPRDFLTATPADPRLEIEQGERHRVPGGACGMEQPMAVAVTCPR
jgi:hypothetical protein